VTVTLAAGTYTIDDPGAPTIVPTANALAAGCVVVDADTVTCPQSAVTSVEVDLGDQNDMADLTDVTEPVTFQGSPGDDTFTGGQDNDTFLWVPGDGSDDLDGGPGGDVLDFTGTNAAEIFVISAMGGGFQLTRNIASVTMTATDVESLVLKTSGGIDQIDTEGLVATSQTIDAGFNPDADTLNYDSGGLCTLQEAGSFVTAGRQAVSFTNFDGIIDTVNLLNQCAATPTPTVTDTATVTETPTVTPTNTPVPDGGGCDDPTDCVSGNCIDDTCCAEASCPAGQSCDNPGNAGVCSPDPPPAPAPALSRGAMLAALVLMITIGGFAILRRRRGPSRSPDRL